MSWNELHNSQAESLECTRRLLLSIIGAPSRHLDNRLILDALISQAAIAKLNSQVTVDNEALNIIPMSLNTYKTRSNERIPGGFIAMDSLRKSAALAISSNLNKPPVRNSRTRESLSEKIKELTHSLELHKRSNLILLQALSDARFKIDGILEAPDEVTRKSRADNLIQRLSAITSINPEAYSLPPINKVPLTLIRSRDKDDETR